MIKAIEKMAGETLPLSMKTDWTELMFLQIRAGNTAIYVFLLSVLSVFLALSALYESWSLPLAVILVVPLCLLCSVVRRAVHGPGRQHLRADRPGGAGRPGVQERHPDRRVRQAVAPRGPTAFRRHPGGVAAAVAADPDDFVRLHPRRGPADGGRRGPGRRCAARWGSPCSAACSA